MDGTDATMLAEAEAAYKGVQGNPGRFGPVAAALVDRARSAGDGEALVVALHAQAWAEHELLRNARARELLDAAVRVAVSADLPGRRAEVLASRAAVQQELGRTAAAHRDLAEAARLVPGARSAALQFQRAVLDHTVGRLRPAGERYRRLLSSSGTPDDVRAKAANNLAEVELARGRPSAAVPWADLAVRLAPALGPVMVAYCTQTRARVLVRAGLARQGLAAFSAARSAYEAAGLDLGEHLVEYADALHDLRLLPEALEAAREGARLSEAGGAPLMAAEALLRVSRLELATGDAAAAHATAARADDLFARQDRLPWRARSRLVAQLALGERADAAALRRVAAVLDRTGLVTDAVEAHLAAGRAAARRGDVERAVASLGLAARRARAGPLPVRLTGRLALAEAARVRGAPTASVLRACRTGLHDLDGHRATLASTELRALASGHGVELALVGLRALLPDASPVRVLGWLELVRAAALSRVARVAPDAGAFDRLRALHADLDAARAAGAADRADRLLARLTEEEQRLREDAWAAPGSVDPAARVPPAVLRRALGARTLVELAELDGDLLAVVVSSSGARLVRLGPAADAQRLVHAVQFALRRLAAGGGASAPAVAATVHQGLDRLRTLLVDPLGVAPTDPLVVAPVGALQRVPWSALHEGPVSVTPSASLWARTARPSDRPSDQPTGRTGATLLVAGPGLPGSHDEVGRLAGLHPGATVLRDPATVPAVLGAFAGAGVAHLSCHAHVRSDSPLFTSLVMDDGPLTLHELLATAAGRGVPEVVVLASCESGVEAAAPGDEPLGFVSTLLAHGSRGVVASSVLVPDDAAVPLMVGLHAGLVAGRSASDALHAARADLDRDDPRALVAWCAFSAYGAG